MKTCLVVNPNAGPSAFKRQLRNAQDHLLKLGCQLKRVDTQSKGDATRLAQQAVEEGFEVKMPDSWIDDNELGYRVFVQWLNYGPIRARDGPPVVAVSG